MKLFIFGDRILSLPSMTLKFDLILMIILALVLLFYNWRDRPTTLYMSLSMLLVVLLIGTIELFYWGNSVFWLAVFYNHSTPFYLLIGPFLYFYVRGTLIDDHRLRRHDIWHFIPFLFQLVAIIPYVIQPWSFKLHVAEMIVIDYRNVARMPELHVYPPVWLRTTLRALSWLCYAGYSFFRVLRFRLHYPGRNRIPFREALPVLRFMLYFLAIHFLMSVVFSAFYVWYLFDVYVERSDFMNQWLRLVFIACASAIPILILFSPAVLYGIPRLVSPQPVDPGEESLTEVTRMDAGSWKDDLDPERSWETEEDGEDVSVRDRFEPLADRILPVMEEGKLYIDPDFSLDDLSQAMGVPKRHLYYCYNVILQTHFTRMRAECRVRHVKRMLLDGNNRHMTLDAIGLSSGFSSATAFRKAFREVTGMSPRDFQRRSDLSGS